MSLPRRRRCLRGLKRRVARERALQQKANKKDAVEMPKPNNSYIDYLETYQYARARVGHVTVRVRDQSYCRARVGYVNVRVRG